MNQMEKIVAIDFETANYHAYSAIAVGVTVIEGREIRESRSWLIRPPSFWFVPAFIDIHGIEPDDVRDAPTFGELWSDLAPYLQGAKLLAHNAAFDRRVLDATAGYYDIDPPPAEWICTLAIARQKWPDLPRHKLNIVCEHLNIPLNHHDAESDALAAAKIYLAA